MLNPVQSISGDKMSVTSRGARVSAFSLPLVVELLHSYCSGGRFGNKPVQPWRQGTPTGSLLHLLLLKVSVMLVVTASSVLGICALPHCIVTLFSSLPSLPLRVPSWR